MKETADIKPVSSEVATSAIQVRSKHKIPENWEMLEFGNFTELFKGKYIPVNNENLRCIELEHFEQGTGRIYGWVDSSEQKSTKNKFQKGQVLFGKLRPYLRKYWLAEFDGVCSSEVWVMNSKNKKCSNEFLFRIIQHDYFIQVANVSSGSKMPRADWDYVASFPFLLPPLPEQRAIAALLSTWDEAIQIVSQLIAQKELSKKWLMQNLLTGKKRLNLDSPDSGIKGLGEVEKSSQSFNPTNQGADNGKRVKGVVKDWNYVRIKAVASEISIKNRGDKELVVLSCTKYNGLVPSLEYFGRKIYADDLTTYKIVPQNHFAYATNHIEEGSIGYQSNYNEALISPMYTVFRTDNSINDQFLFKLLKSFNYIHHYQKRMEGSIDRRGGLRWDEFSKIKIPLPSLEEQYAITQILQTSDIELQLLREKLEMLKEQKKGLMQILLTGKKRLNLDFPDSGIKGLDMTEKSSNPLIQ